MRESTKTASATATLAFGLALAAVSAQAAPATQAAVTTPQSVTEVSDWVVASGDNAGLPYMIIDKVAAVVAVYEADGARRGVTPALLGLARGDDSVPGIGDRKLSSIKPGERTTPAGRFLAAYGPAAGKAKVLWVDYGTAISLHPVPGGNPKEQRQRRLKSRTPKDNRITYGCINVPAGFYENVVRRTFTGSKGVVYVLPETRPLETAFPFVRSAPRMAAATSGEPAEGADVASVSETSGADDAGSTAIDASLTR